VVVLVGMYTFWFAPCWLAWLFAMGSQFARCTVDNGRGGHYILILYIMDDFC
jgi:hypothetical protein